MERLQAGGRGAQTGAAARERLPEARHDHDRNLVSFLLRLRSFHRFSSSVFSFQSSNVVVVVFSTQRAAGGLFP